MTVIASWKRTLFFDSAIVTVAFFLASTTVADAFSAETSVAPAKVAR